MLRTCRRISLVVVLGFICFCETGCARIMQALFAPQQTALNTADAIAGRADNASAPVRSELDSMRSEVDRLLAGQPRNAADLQRIHQEILASRLPSGQHGSAQNDPARTSPWHSRLREVAKPGDTLKLAGNRSGHPAERGTFAYGSFPDGIPHANLPAPIDLTPIRLRR